MISIRVPLRVSLFGGGTDLTSYFKENGGRVVGYTINKYIYIQSSRIEVQQGFKFRLSYRINEEVNYLGEIKHPIFREVLREYNLDDIYHFTTMSCLPAGAGLGSSSAFTVGLCYLLNEISGFSQDSMKLAKQAINIERNVLAEAGGWQDQLHPSFGGLNSFEFLPDGGIVRKSINLDKDNIDRLNSNMYLLYSGVMREAKIIEASKMSNKNDSSLGEVADIAMQGENLLRSGDFELEEIGSLLNAGWEIKRKLSSEVSNTGIDDLYDLIMSSGAYGAKLCGAGGGGFFMVLASPESANYIRSRLPSGSLLPIGIDFSGIRRIDL